MAEFVLRDMVEKRGLGDNFIIASAATSAEEIGNPVHNGTKNKLKEHGIIVQGKQAVQLKKKDYDDFDFFIGMELRNIINMKRMLGTDPMNKVKRLLDFTKNPRVIADPWFTGNFDQTYEDIYEGCNALLEHISSTMINK
jgi:protein-tyrosine phosphatase